MLEDRHTRTDIIHTNIHVGTLPTYVPGYVVRIGAQKRSKKGELIGS